MGSTATSASFDFTSYARTATAASASATHHGVFKSRAMNPLLDPKTFMVRESRNSPANPKSTPIIIGVDVTGSMGSIAHEIVKNGLGVLIKEIIARVPVSDPHIMFQAIGDADYDSAPLQASQFETDNKIVDQLEQIYVEGGGGGNAYESYNLPWHFAAYHTSCDAFEKDGRKGFLFTMGDENVPPDLTPSQLKKVYGRDQEVVATNKDLLEALASKYHVFHLIIDLYSPHDAIKVVGFQINCRIASEFSGIVTLFIKKENPYFFGIFLVLICHRQLGFGGHFYDQSCRICISHINPVNF